MADYKTFCDRYGLDPDSQEAREQYREATAQLAILQTAAARAEAQEAITKARRGE
jgi:hypothetical protein